MDSRSLRLNRPTKELWIGRHVLTHVQDGSWPFRQYQRHQHVVGVRCSKLRRGRRQRIRHSKTLQVLKTLTRLG